MTYAFDIVDEISDRFVVTARITVPKGQALLLADYQITGRTLHLTAAHIFATTTLRLTMSDMRTVANLVMRELDYDCIIVEGALRTTGARPGHRPRTLRFDRDG